MTRRVELLVNNVPIPLSYFVENFIDHTVGGMMVSLEGTGEIETLDIDIDADKVVVNLNDAVVPTNQFVNEIIRSTIFGMISTLKGVSEIKGLNLSIRR